MKSFQIRMLSPADALALLQFELENRDWFESAIEARLGSFYSIEGVNRHIAELIEQYDCGTAYPAVIIDSEGEILGRANLKNHDHVLKSAELGYRIAHAHTRQGLASTALSHLIAIARVEWNLEQLFAYVSDNNTGSIQVLKKAGFVADQSISELTQVQGNTLSGHRYSLLLNANL